jgi:hypothetical protein
VLSRKFGCVQLGRVQMKRTALHFLAPPSLAMTQPAGSHIHAHQPTYLD